MAKKRDYTKEPPKDLTELNKESMLLYVENLGKEEDLIWFIDLMDANAVEKEFNFDTKDGKHKKGDKLKGYDMPVVRKAFAKKYFPKLVEPKPKKPTTSFEKKLEELRQKVNK